MENKVAQSAADLDTARCRGDWSSIPQLAQRYKKYHPDETVLDATACIEAELVDQIQSTRQRTATAQEHANDTPDSIHNSPSLNSLQSQSFARRIQDIIRGKKANLDLPDDRQAQFTKIILARIYFESGDYDKALESLQNLALRIEDATSGYGLVLLVQARAIKGICYEKQNNITAAIDAFSTAWDVVEQHLKAKSEMLWYWMEECLYHGILLQLRVRSSPLRLMRAYLKLANSYWSKHWRTCKQWVVFCLSARHVAKIDGLNNDSDIVSSLSDLDDLIPVMDILRKLFRSLASVCTTTELNQRTVELANLTAQVHDRVGWGDARHLRRVLRFLYQAKEHTFNSADITRHLLFTLMRLGDFDEAKHTFVSYMDLVGASDITYTDEPRQYEASHVLRRMGLVNETAVQLLSVLLIGAELYGKIYSNGKIATIIMHLALDVVEELDEEDDLSEMVARTYRVHGAACGVYARQCDDPDTRSEYHNKAIKSLIKAVRLQEEELGSSSATASWQSYYELAVEQAITRNLHDAASSTSKSIQLEPNHLASWHLLALIYSCQENKEPQALQTLEAGLNTSTTLLTEYSTVTAGAAPVMSWNKNEKSMAQYVSLAESHLAVSMTQVQLLEKLEGPEAVLDLYTDLFSMYAKLATHLLKNDDDMLQATTAEVETGVVGDPAAATANGRHNSMSSSRRTSRSHSLSNADPRRRSNSTSANHRRPSELNGNTSDVPPVSPSANTNLPPRRMKTSSSDEIRSDRRGSDVVRNRSSSISRESKSIRKKSMQLIDMGFARRMGSTQQSTKQFSSGSTLYDERSTSSSEASSATLMSLLTPSFSAASMGAAERRPSNTTATISSIIDKPTHFYTRYQRDRWYHLLVKLWLMSTTTFIRAGRLEEATKAIVEAEQQLLVGQMNDASVWYQLGLVCIQKAKKVATTVDQAKLHDTGLDAFKKALAIDPDHIEALVAMARCFIDMEEWELAEGLLDRATRGYGWDNAEAWYCLGICYRHAHNLEQAKNCFQYAVELSETTPLQSFSQLPRFVQ
ncbi:hypothetical protein BDB00DRAFT_109803 [Zychaea mexicana]|uniref:uncharacterized protein n=1 Tax=Zychaea mexicana TaxID=64656 RepID=UPI0022FEAABB|nr:uncharacterized protein BDB00DRAFT_109803 [Zychaea mexicana]KAI9484821.1 hypothetical protein BDB00DRAFT_109803 [Zychaea mexicana]